METLRKPERLEADPVMPGRQRAFRRIPQFGNRWLRVVYDTTADDVLVVTTFFDRRAGRPE